MSFKTVNPYNLQTLKQYDYHTPAFAYAEIKKLKAEQTKWEGLSLQQRANYIMQIAEKLSQHKEKLALQMTLEMGKPIVQARLEIEKCALGLKLFCDLVKNENRDLSLTAHYDQTQLRAEAYGLILSIQPWNFPFWQVFRMASGAWMAGNLIVLKHSDLTAGCADLIEEICNTDDFKLLINLRLTHADTAELITNSAELEMVTLTGSTSAGRQVGAVAGAALKKTIFELGGSDAYIVLPDADLKNAVQACVRSRMTNSGQSCIAAKRFFVHAEIYSEFKKLFLDEMATYVSGDPLSEKTQVGPLAHTRFIESVKMQLSKAKSLGAELTEVKSNHGPQFSPMGILEFSDRLELFKEEEIFAPVGSFYRFTELSRVVEVVNSGPYALGAAVFTSTPKLADELSRDIRVGMLAVNSSVQSDVRAPFGGRRLSGIGREGGLAGLNEFTSWKLIGHKRLK